MAEPADGEDDVDGDEVLDVDLSAESVANADLIVDPPDAQSVRRWKATSIIFVAEMERP